MTGSLFHTLNISARDLSNRLLDLDTISNNLSNENTAGFRSTRLNFQEFLSSQNYDGSKINNSQILTGEGDVVNTDSPYDWAIKGDGFFQVTLANGEIGYTRDGVFHLDADQKLVNSSGNRLVLDGTIPKDATDISVSESGEVTANLADGTTKSVGTVQLAQFENPTALINAGNNVWISGDASGKATLSNPGENDCGLIQSHAYESSNVNLTDELTHLIQVQRGFQMSSKVFQQTDTMISEAIHMRKA